MRGFDMAMKEVCTVDVDATIVDAAKAMRDHHVGALVVTDDEKVAGIVTDRDIVVGGLAEDVPADGRVDMVMTHDPITIEEAADLDDALAIFNAHAFRRLPVMRDGALCGIVTVDDVLVLIAARLSLAARPIIGEALFPSEERANELVLAKT